MVNRHYLKTTVSITETQLGIPQDYKQKCIKELYRLGDSLGKKSNVKAIMTTWDVWEESKVFNLLLRNILQKHIDLGYNQDVRFDLAIQNAWGAIYKKGDHTVPHSHHPSYCSFVYYLKSNGQTPLIFGDCNFEVNPLDDDLIIFPSHVMHHVPPHKDDEDRICIAGNLEAIQKADFKDEDQYIK